MLEKTGNIWDNLGNVDAICVTTNGIVKQNGALVMGRGIAEEAVQKFPGIQFTLGSAVKRFGNIPVIAHEVHGTRIISFPTKYDWKDPSDMFLIQSSAEKLKAVVSSFDLKSVVLPRPGCGFGNLNWVNVKRILEPIFDDRFTIYSF